MLTRVYHIEYGPRGIDGSARTACRRIRTLRQPMTVYWAVYTLGCKLAVYLRLFHCVMKTVIAFGIFTIDQSTCHDRLPVVCLSSAKITFQERG